MRIKILQIWLQTFVHRAIHISKTSWCIPIFISKIYRNCNHRCDLILRSKSRQKFICRLCIFVSLMLSCGFFNLITIIKCIVDHISYRHRIMYIRLRFNTKQYKANIIICFHHRILQNVSPFLQINLFRICSQNG